MREARLDREMEGRRRIASRNHTPGVGPHGGWRKRAEHRNGTLLALAPYPANLACCLLRQRPTLPNCRRSTPAKRKGANRAHIERAMEQARVGLAEATKSPWQLSNAASLPTIESLRVVMETGGARCAGRAGLPSVFAGRGNARRWPAIFERPRLARCVAGTMAA